MKGSGRLEKPRLHAAQVLSSTIIHLQTSHESLQKHIVVNTSPKISCIQPDSGPGTVECPPPCPRPGGLHHSYEACIAESASTHHPLPTSGHSYGSWLCNWAIRFPPHFCHLHLLSVSRLCLQVSATSARCRLLVFQNILLSIL